MTHTYTPERLQGFAEFFNFMPDDMKARLSRAVKAGRSDDLRDFMASRGCAAGWFDAFVDSLLTWQDTITAERIISGSCTPAHDLLTAVDSDRLSYTEAERALSAHYCRRVDLYDCAAAESDFMRANDI